MISICEKSVKNVAYQFETEPKKILSGLRFVMVEDLLSLIGFKLKAFCEVNTYLPLDSNLDNVSLLNTHLW